MFPFAVIVMGMVAVIGTMLSVKLHFKVKHLRVSLCKFLALLKHISRYVLHLPVDLKIEANIHSFIFCYIIAVA